MHKQVSSYVKNEMIKKPLIPFITFLVLFYATWLTLVSAGGYWNSVEQHWPMAAAMTLGSYVAGSTPMGGGTVGFPVLVLLMDMPARLGRDFSFAIQAVGMTSASIYILCSRQKLAWPLLRAALPGALAGMPLGVFILAPLVSDLFIKLLFASMWCSFGLLHLHRLDEITAYTGIIRHSKSFDRRAGFLLGFIGAATVTSITGAGIDMMIYMVLVLWCHADLKIAIPTSVVLMAFTSLVGVMFKLSSGGLQPGTFANWLAAAPVVALGAPFGAFVVSKVGRRPTLKIVSVLCVLQLAWTLVHERLSLSRLDISLTLLAVLLFLLLFQWLYRKGRLWVLEKE